MWRCLSEAWLQLRMASWIRWGEEKRQETGARKEDYYYFFFFLNGGFCLFDEERMERKNKNKRRLVVQKRENEIVCSVYPVCGCSLYSPNPHPNIFCSLAIIFPTSISILHPIWLPSQLCYEYITRGWCYHCCCCQRWFQITPAKWTEWYKLQQKSPAGCMKTHKKNLPLCVFTRDK